MIPARFRPKLQVGARGSPANPTLLAPVACCQGPEIERSETKVGGGTDHDYIRGLGFRVLGFWGLASGLQGLAFRAGLGFDVFRVCKGYRRV